MRITTKNLQRTYLKGLNQNIKKLSDSNERLNTGRRFSRLSQNVVDGSKALRVRELMQRNLDYISNAQQVQLELSSQEDKIMQMQNLVQDAKELMIRGYSQTHNEDDRKIISGQLDQIKEAIVQIINSKSVDKYTFATHHNEPPIQVNGSDITFHGQNVNHNNRSDFANGAFNVNIGFLMNINQSAIDVLGYGVDASGIPNNILVLLNDISTSLTNNDTTHQAQYTAKIDTIATQMLMKVSDIGMKVNYLDTTLSRFGDENLALTTKQNNLEAIDFEEEVIFNKMYEMAWQISLQLGSKVLPLSIFDFMR